jgi:phosphatidylserine decarboxylase
MSISTRVFIGLQYVWPQHGLTALIHWLARLRLRSLTRWLIRGFRALYPINMAEALETDTEQFESFNAFFTRALAPGARPLDAQPNSLVSPCDGTVSECGKIDSEYLLQAKLTAKSFRYSLTELLADTASAHRYMDGSFATIYLAPYDYHRVHMPISGTLTSIRYVPGALFSVNGATARAVPKLFARNERVIAEFTTTLGPLAVIFVGALNVGSISIVGLGDLTPCSPRQIRRYDLPAVTSFSKGAELGRFNMGSTVIVLAPRQAIAWIPSLQAGTTVRMGQMIGQWQPRG